MLATLEQKIDQIGQQIGQIGQQTDRLIQFALTNKDDIDELKRRVTRLEDAQERCFNKLDEFITRMKANELEIVALRAQYARLEERIEMLEAARV